MSRLVLDHVRRWGWVLALCGLYAFWQGWAMAHRPQGPFEFWILILAMWSGVMLLSFDLRRGAARPLALLPLTRRQAGRALWLATVLLPALVMSALLFLGGWVYCRVSQDALLPVPQLGWASLFTALWLGLFFNCIETSSVGVLSTVMMFAGLIYFQDTSQKPFKLLLFLATAGALAVAGWHRPERFFHNPAGPRLGGGQFKHPHAQSQPPSGDGGIRLLIRSHSLRLFWYVAFIIAGMGLFSSWGGWPGSEESRITMMANMGAMMSGWFMASYGLTSLLRHLRVLRTMPISAGRLAAVLLAITLLPFVAVGPLAAAVAGAAWGAPAALILLKSYVLILAPLGICLVLAVWRGAGMVTQALQLIVLFAFYLAPTWLHAALYAALYADLSLGATAGVAGGCVGLCFFMTRGVLERSSHPYRIASVPIN